MSTRNPAKKNGLISLKPVLALLILPMCGHSALAASQVAFVTGSRLEVIGNLSRRAVDVQTGKVTASFARAAQESEVCPISPAPGGQVVALGTESTIQFWNVASGKMLRSIKAADTVESLAFSPDGKVLASGLLDGTVSLSNVATSKELLTFKVGKDEFGNYGITEGVRFVVFSPDGKTIASGSQNGLINVWNVATGKLVWKLAYKPSEVDHLHDYPLYTAAYSPDGKTLVLDWLGKSLRFYNAASGQLIKTLVKEQSHVESLAYSPNGRTLAVGSAYGLNTLQLWNVSSGKVTQTLVKNAVKKTPDDSVNSLAFSPDGKTLASATFEAATTLWDVTSGKPIWKLTGIVKKE